jgi:long-chain fatty acid transport protein
VPNLALTFPINKQWSVGLGVNVPFGLVTDYNDSWLGRYQGIKSDVKTMNVMPALSYRVNDQFSIGVGANYQKIDATFTQSVNYSAGLLGTAALAGIAPGSATYNAIAAQTGGLDAKATIDGDDYAWGWNVGVLWQIDRNSRLGAHYRSAIKYDVTGNASFEIPQLPAIQPPQLAATVAALAANFNAARLANSGITASVKVPDKANVSYFRTLNDQWDIMADVQWTGWSSLQDLTFVRTTGAVLSSTPYNWDDSWRAAVGANYRYNDKLMLRGGFAWDQTPISEEFITVRLPDSDRYWLSIGAKYTFQPNLWMDAGFTYIFANSTNINKTGDPPGCNSPATCIGGYGLVKGSYDAYVTIFSLQLNYAF